MWRKRIWKWGSPWFQTSRTADIKYGSSWSFLSDRYVSKAESECAGRDDSLGEDEIKDTFNREDILGREQVLGLLEINIVLENAESRQTF